LFATQSIKYSEKYFPAWQGQETLEDIIGSGNTRKYYRVGKTENTAPVTINFPIFINLHYLMTSIYFLRAI